MRISLIVGHPKVGSFNHAIAEAAVEVLEKSGHDVSYHDLYLEKFDPILPDSEIPKVAPVDPAVQMHCDEIAAAEGIVIVHPNWWGQPPAILKGWIDRVLCQGVAYEFGAGGTIVEHLAGKTAVVITTSNTPRDIELAVFGDPLENLWKTCIFGFCGVRHFGRRNFESIVLSTPAQRQGWLAEVGELVAEFFPPPV